MRLSEVSRLGVLLLSTVGLMPCSVDGQQERPEAGVRSASSRAVATHTIAGVVVDAATGELIQGGQVFLGGTQIGALTDSLGRFSFDTRGAGRFQIVARLIGYAETVDTIDVEPGQGVVVQVGLTKATLLRNCGLIVCGGYECGAVRVQVRDALSGRAPKVPIALRVRRDTLVDWAIDSADEDRESVFLGAGTGVGPFDVEVAARGYATWTASDVKVERDECGSVVTRPFQVWLLPVREEP